MFQQNIFELSTYICGSELERLKTMTLRSLSHILTDGQDFLSQLKRNAYLMHEHNVEQWAIKFWTSPVDALAHSVDADVPFVPSARMQSLSCAELNPGLVEAELEWEASLNTSEEMADSDPYWENHCRETLAIQEKALRAHGLLVPLEEDQEEQVIRFQAPPIVRIVPNIEDEDDGKQYIAMAQ